MIVAFICGAQKCTSGFSCRGGRPGFRSLQWLAWLPSRGAISSCCLTHSFTPLVDENGVLRLSPSLEFLHVCWMTVVMLHSCVTSPMSRSIVSDVSGSRPEFGLHRSRRGDLGLEEHNGAGNGGKVSAYLRFISGRVEVDGTCEVHTAKALACPLLNFVAWSFGNASLRGNITFPSTVRESNSAEA